MINLPMFVIHKVAYELKAKQNMHLYNFFKISVRRYIVITRTKFSLL